MFGGWQAASGPRGPTEGAAGPRRAGSVIAHALSPLVRIVLPFALIVAGLFVASMVTREAGDDGGCTGTRTAVIIDQLSLTFPNEAFVEAATDILDQAGYEVNYVPGEDVTVGFYRDLPAGGYDIIVLRVSPGSDQVAERGPVLVGALQRGQVRRARPCQGILPARRPGIL